MKRIINILLVMFAIVAILIIIGAVSHKSENSACNKAYVEIFRENEKGFIDKEVILSKFHLADSSMAKKSIVDVDIIMIEDSLLSNPFVKEVDAYFSIDSKLIINIKERQPILRIFTDDNSFYIDNDGDIFPVSSKFAPMVMVANGYVGKYTNTINTNIYDSIYNNSKIRNLFLLNKMIKQYPLLSSQIGQLYINSNNEYDIIPELGNHIVQLGDFTDIETKLKNLNAYYEEILKTHNWDKYNIINMTYKNQIVCTKK